MGEPRLREVTSRPFLIAASLVILVAGLKAGAALIVPFLVALFLALLSLPVLRWLVERGARPSLAALLTVLAVIAVLAVFGFLVSGAAIGFADAVPVYLELLFNKARSALETLSAQGIVLSEWVAIERLDPAPLMDMAGGIVRGTVKGVASGFSYTILVLLTTIFLLAEATGFPAKLGLAFGGREYDTRRFIRVTHEIQRYLGLKTLTSAATGLLIGVWVAIVGVEFALFWGLLAFVLNYIPIIGSIVASIPAILLTLVQYGTGRALAVAAGYLVVNIVIGNIVEPQLMGRRFGMSTLVVFLALGFWGWVWGPIGALLSVPLTMMLKIALEHTPNLRWIAVLLGPGPSAVRAPPPRQGGQELETEAGPEGGAAAHAPNDPRAS